MVQIMKKGYPIYRHQAAFNFSRDLWRHTYKRLWHIYHLTSKVHSCIMAYNEIRNHSAFPQRLPHIWPLPGWKAEAIHLELPQSVVKKLAKPRAKWWLMGWWGRHDQEAADQCPYTADWFAWNIGFNIIPLGWQQRPFFFWDESTSTVT